VTQDFDRLFRAEYPRLVRALTLASGDAELAADAVQDAFLQAHRHWRRVRGYSDPAAWLRRVAVNRLANGRRGARRLQGYLARAPRADPVAPTDVAALVDLRAAVAGLSRQQRLVVALHYLLDLPVAEVARTMEVAPGTVRSHLHAARQSLAGVLGDPGDAAGADADSTGGGGEPRPGPACSNPAPATASPPPRPSPARGVRVRPRHRHRSPDQPLPERRVRTGRTSSTQERAVNDLWKDQLERLAAPPADDVVEAALRSVLGRSRRRKALATVGVAAATTAVVGAAVLATRGAGSDDVSTGPSGQGDDRRDQTTTTTDTGEVLGNGEGDGDGFPWTTSTTTPGTEPTDEQLDAANQAMMENEDPDLLVFGIAELPDGRRVVAVDLQADAVDLAAQIWEEWGSIVEVNLGHRIYPTGERSRNALGECPEAALGEQVPDTEGTIDLGSGTLVSGDDVTATVTLRNDGDRAFQVVAPLSAGVARADVPSETVGVSTAVFAMSGEEAAVIDPGQEADFSVVIGTTACGPDGPPGVAPGAYAAAVAFTEVQADGSPTGRMVTVTAPLTVTPAG
jgi:RNA polymerase sigma-70 factor (ECF subfamily)